MTQTDLVLVPGLGLDERAWRPTVEALSTRGLDADRVRVAHLPGYGLPAVAGPDLGPEATARRLLESALGPEPVVLAGHSAGCQVVAHTAALAPDRVAALVLVGPTTDPRAAGWPRLAARWARTALHEPKRQVPALVRQWSGTGLRPMARAMTAARRDRIDRTLRDVDQPVLLLRGPRDAIAPADWLDVLARDGRPDARRTAVTLERGAHMVPFVHGDLVAEKVADFLAALG